MKKILKWFFILVVIAAIITPGDYEENQGGATSDNISFYVQDDANVISDLNENYVMQLNARLENHCGGQIVVTTVDFTDGLNIEDYAYKLFNEKKIGDKTKNNGVLLLLVIGEENYWCMQGKGLEKSLPSSKIDQILWDYLEKDFTKGNYDEGVKKTVEVLFEEVKSLYEDENREEKNDDTSEENGASLIHYIIGAGIILMILGSLLNLFGTREKTPSEQTTETEEKPKEVEKPRPKRKKKNRRKKVIIIDEEETVAEDEEEIYFYEKPEKEPESAKVETTVPHPVRTETPESKPKVEEKCEAMNTGGGGSTRGGGAGRRGR